MLNKVLAALIVVFSLATISLAQDDGHFDASVGWGAVFSKSASSNIGNVTLAPTNSGLVFGTFRFRFNRTHGIAFNIGRTDNSQIFILPPDSYRLETSITEYTGAYTLNLFHFQKLEPFLFAGGGALRFYPGKTFIDGFQNGFPAYTQTSLAFLYGGGVDYPVWRRVALRLQYRGLIYKEPTLRIQQFFTGVRGHMAEPAIGVVFRF
jgi:opacity protein-like surface antigen